jgi:hypothetical protein
MFNLQLYMEKVKLNPPHILGNSLCCAYLIWWEQLLAGLKGELKSSRILESCILMLCSA